mgnify:CR=1 FL=1
MDLFNEIRLVEESKLKDLKNFMNSLTDIIVLTDGVTIKEANKKLFDFFGYDSLKMFLKDHNCICDYFEKDDAFFHTDKLVNNDLNWVEYIKSLEPTKRIVSMKSNNGNIHIFGVHINRFTDDLYSILFSNETSSYIEKSNLQRKVIKDKLTGAFNREYFDMVIDDLIDNNDNSNENFSFCMLDIDHFKDVNDNYGHNVGDEVLKELVNLIKKNSRSEDILIRWGGEEFILILKVKDKKALHSATENLRITIKNYLFSHVDHLTCSFGASFYKNDEQILDTIKRTDSALYIAKNNGRNQVTIV